jgi:hypothetical protein
VYELTERSVGLKVLTGQGATIDSTTASGKLVCGIFAALAEFDRELVFERTKVGLAVTNFVWRFLRLHSAVFLLLFVPPLKCTPVVRMSHEV